MPKRKTQHDLDNRVGRAVLAHVPTIRLKHGTTKIYSGRVSLVTRHAGVLIRPARPCKANSETIQKHNLKFWKQKQYNHTDQADSETENQKYIYI
jgi:hypothetical protein